MLRTFLFKHVTLPKDIGTMGATAKGLYIIVGVLRSTQNDIA